MFNKAEVSKGGRNLIKSISSVITMQLQVQANNKHSHKQNSEWYCSSCFGVGVC